MGKARLMQGGGCVRACPDDGEQWAGRGGGGRLVDDAWLGWTWKVTFREGGGSVRFVA